MIPSDSYQLACRYLTFCLKSLRNTYSIEKSAKFGKHNVISLVPKTEKKTFVFSIYKIEFVKSKNMVECFCKLFKSNCFQRSIFQI